MEHSISTPIPSLLWLTRNRDSNSYTQELRGQRSGKRDWGGSRRREGGEGPSFFSLLLNQPGTYGLPYLVHLPRGIHAPDNSLAYNVQGRQPLTSVSQPRSLGWRRKAWRPGRAGEKRVRRAAPRGVPQRPPSSRHRSGGATAGSCQHRHILRGCRGPAPPGNEKEEGGRSTLLPPCGDEIIHTPKSAVGEGDPERGSGPQPPTLWPKPSLSPPRLSPRIQPLGAQGS